MPAWRHWIRPWRTLRPVEPWDLSAPLLSWNKLDAFTIGNAVEGTLVLGATGSGKTSGSGRAIATAFLSAGFGGLVLTAKPDERRNWEGYCRDTGGGWSHALVAHERPEEALTATTRLAAGAVVLKGDRGDAADVASALLHALEGA